MSEAEKAVDAFSEMNLGDVHKQLGEDKEANLNASCKDTVVTIGATVPTSFELTAADEVQELGKDKEANLNASCKEIVVTIGATVPTGFELTAADEVQEKLGSLSRISKDRGKIYFDIPAIMLPQVHQLRSVDNLFVVVQEFKDYQFKEKKEEALNDLEDLAKKLPWINPLHIWKLNTSLKKKKTRQKKSNQQSNTKKQKSEGDMKGEGTVKGFHEPLQNVSGLASAGSQDSQKTDEMVQPNEDEPSDYNEERASNGESASGDCKKSDMEGQVLKFRVTCNRAGDNHSFTSNEAARDFGGAVQDFFQWKADMTNFDVEVLLNIHSNEIVVGIALTEESLHRRNITHFGPTTLRSTLAYGMLRLCNPQPADIIIDPMCGTGAIPIEGAAEWPNCFHIAGDNSPQAVKRTANNISSLLKQIQSKESSSSSKPIDNIQWDICSLPLRTGSVDVIVTDMPFGKRIGSKKKNWDLYPACLMEMGRICRPGTGRAVLLTQDRKCFAKALSKMGHVWRKSHTIWVNVGGLHAAVYLLKRLGEKNEETKSKW